MASPETGSTGDQGDQLTVESLPKDLEDDRINIIKAALVIQRRNVDMQLQEISS